MKDRNGRLRQCSSRNRVTVRSLLSLAFLPAANALQLFPFIPNQQVPSIDTTRAFTLRHIFHRGTYQDPDLHKRLDIKPDTQFTVAYEDETPYYTPPPRFEVESEVYNIERLSDRSWPSIQNHLDHASWTGYPAVLDDSMWTMDQIDGPNTTNKKTVVNLALMAANAYVPEVGEGEWSNVTEGYNHSTSFGWEGDGLRGHIFADEGNNTVIIGLKGTSPAVFDGDGTTTRDKVNDNLFFSCCCAQGGQFFWRQVCDCQSGTYSCNSTCLIKALKSKTRYYGASVDLYNNVTALYPNSNIWIVGHSLGGAVSSLLGLTFGLPVVTFEAPGDDLAARRLGLPVPPTSRHIGSARGAYTGARHFGHTADPIYMGTCNTATATCTLGGYAMESQCHTGLTCIYDTVADFGWRVGIGYHKIHNVIDNVIKKYDTVPRCIPDDECYDCFNWKFFKSNGSEGKPSTTTTSTTTSPLTRTTTCKTPGWWGCLDESSTSSTPIITTTYTTTTCLTPGWFGCNVEATTTITTTTEAPTTSPKSQSAPTTTTSSCRPGWFGGGCTSTSNTITPPSASSKHHTATATKTHDDETCETPGFFWGCKDKRHHHTSTASITSAPTMTASATSKVKPTSTAHKEKCKHPAFFGLICMDSTDSETTYERGSDDGANSSEL